MSKNKKSVKLEATSQIDGKATEVGTRQVYGSLDQILGETLSIYTTTDIDTYEKQISDMNNTDLQTHAQKVGLVPIDDRRVLASRLVHEFKKWISTITPQHSSAKVQSFSDLSLKAQKILREGA
jgi:uncharacterized protein related to proFAR isomerase